MSSNSIYKVFIVEFTTPYQVKYHGIPSLPEEIIDASIVLRSIVYASSLINDGNSTENLVKAIVNGYVRSTSILPVIELEGGRKSIPLIPFPALLKALIAKNLGKGNIKVLKGIKYTTPKTLESLSKNTESGTVEVVEEDGVELRVGGEAYRVKAGVLVSLAEGVIDKIKPPLFHYVDFIRNRIDRLSGASDPYHSSYVMPSQKMYFILELPDNNNIIETVLSAVMLLEDIGIGSKRSIGLGKFRISMKKEEVKKEEIKKKVLDLREYNKELYEAISRSNGYWVAMGKYAPGNTVPEKLFYEVDIVAGIGGHILPYRLPAVKVMLPGATVGCFDSPPKGLTRQIQTPYKSIIVFNPIFYGIRNIGCVRP